MQDVQELGSHEVVKERQGAADNMVRPPPLQVDAPSDLQNAVLHACKSHEVKLNTRNKSAEVACQVTLQLGLTRRERSVMKCRDASTATQLGGAAAAPLLLNLLPLGPLLLPPPAAPLPPLLACGLRAARVVAGSRCTAAAAPAGACLPAAAG